MNKTLLLIICDFLLLNLLALTRWEEAEPVRPQRTPVATAGASSQTPDQDLVAAMKESLTDERETRELLAEKLGTREQALAALQSEKSALSASLAETQRTAADLSQKFTAAASEATMTKEQLAQLQKELEQRRADADRQQKALSALEKEQSEARQKIEGLSVAVRVAEQEKQLLRETADTFKQQAEAERQERAKVQATTIQLAEGVGQLAEKSGELTKEIRENRPINTNTIYSDFLANRVRTAITASRSGFFGTVNGNKESQTVFATDGKQVYALIHLANTPFSSYLQPGNDWDRLQVEFSRGPSFRASAAEMHFLSIDPRVIAVPLPAAQAAALAAQGIKVYDTALDPVKFPEAVLVSETANGYGEFPFKLDAAEPGYVRVDNRFFRRLFGDFAPGPGDLVFSKSGELLGIMVNNDYCAVVNNFLPSRTIRTGENIRAQGTAAILNSLAGRYRSLPVKLQ